MAIRAAPVLPSKGRNDVEIVPSGKFDQLAAAERVHRQRQCLPGAAVTVDRHLLQPAQHPAEELHVEQLLFGEEPGPPAPSVRAVTNHDWVEVADVVGCEDGCSARRNVLPAAHKHRPTHDADPGLEDAGDRCVERLHARITLLHPQHG
jgi:hypothetical protein